VLPFANTQSFQRYSGKGMPDQDFQGRVAVVTGASLGIGRATAVAFGREGARVVVNYRSHREQAEEVVQAVRAVGSQAIAVQADVADQAAVEKLIARTVEEFGQLDIAVSNAAYSDRELFFQADMAGFRRTVDVTMWGAFYLMRAATQQMIKQGKGGAICIVSSPHAFIPAPRAMAYNMSKAAIEHMARTAAIEVAEYRIRINLIQPGWTDTPGELKFASRETLDSAGAKIPLGRLGTAEEMAEGILFLSSPRNEYITGAALLVDGGISLPWWANRGSAAPA
jgi:glucose 1-dehydrogenase